MIGLLFLLLGSVATAPAGEPSFVYSATFAYQDHPKDLWPARLAQLKAMGFNAVQIPPSHDSDLPELLRLARQMGLRVWVERGSPGPELEPYLGSRGGPILDDLSGKIARWFPSEERRFLYASDFASLRRLLQKEAVVSSLDAGWPAGDDLRARPSDPSNYLFAFREAMAAGAKAVNCSAVVEGRTPADREAALNVVGEPRPQARVLSRNGALVRQFGRLLAGMRPRKDAGGQPAVEILRPPAEKPFPLLRLGMLASPAPRGPAFISALNYSEDRAVTGTLAAADPRTGKRILLRPVNLPPRQALLMPMNLTLAAPEVCPTCSSFAPGERLVWATAELVSVAFENGVLAMEFVAPGEADAVLELARQPRGPLVTGARLRDLDWDDKAHRLRLRIPAGKPPEFRSRVGLGIELPDTSAFLKAPPRLILGSTAPVTATFSSPELAGRGRLLVPPGWRVKPDPRGAAEIEYGVEIPADAVAGDTVTLAVEADGKVAQSVTLPLAPACSVRIEPEETLHPRRDARFPIRPHLATLLLPGRRQYRIYLRNNYDAIRTFELAAAGEGLEFSPPRLEVPVGANLEREVTLYVSPQAPRPGLYRWTLVVRDGAWKTETPLALAVIAPGESLAYELDLDRDGWAELVLENATLRAVFSPRQGGRSTEFLLKEAAFNAFTGRGALDAGAPLEGRVLGPGRIELRSADLVRRISLGGGDPFFEIEQTGGPAEWEVSTGPVEEPAAVRFDVSAPDAKIDTERRPYSTQIRVRFPEEALRRARFVLERK